MAASNHIMLLAILIVSVVLSLSLLAEGQSGYGNGSQIQGIRLVNRDGTIGGSQGRVEVQYNGQWGTICDSSWYTTEARVACRMLGFEDAFCAVRNSYFGRASYSTPTWMNYVSCGGYESALDLCYFRGWGVSSCSHYDDAGVVCRDESTTLEVGTPSNIRLIESSTTTLTIGWTAPASPSWTTYRRFTIRYEPEGGYYRTRTYYNSSYINDTDVEMTYTLTSLTRDTQYSIQIRADIRNSACGYYYSYINGNYSDPVSFQTNATRRQSNIPVRLVSPTPGLNYIGRVEVYHNGQWGTVCDDYFSTTEANVICQMLNFTQGALCSVGYAGFGQGQGQIWLDNVDCQAGDEVLEDCNHSPWGVTSCTHHEDVGVVCRPNTTDAYTAVQNLTVLSAGPTYITLGWDQYTFPPGATYTRFQLQYRSISSTSYYGYTQTRSFTATSSLTQYTLRYLQFGETYNISIRAYFQFSRCYSYIYGGYSNNVTATTMETAPTAPPRDFYVVGINRTAIEAEWDLPPTESRGGFILGYKLFVQSTNGGEERPIVIPDNTTEVYTVGGLQPATSYRLSVLAYTSVGDGPRSIALTVPTLRYDPLITQFGYYGNGQDRITRYTSSYSYSSYYYGRVHIHCASNNFTYARPNWFFANGSLIGVRDRNFQVGHFSNGTAVLKIADQRPLSYCDGGIFTCRVINTASNHSQEKNFTLTINTSPPSPGRPFLVKAQSTSITIGWSEAVCDGGHAVNNFNIRYRRSYSSSYYSSSYSYIRDIDPARRNYTITGLQSNTYYSFDIQAVNLHATSSSYSSSLSFTTLPPAPSPPRDVTARLVTPLKVEVSWRPPAVPNGAISHYYVYAIPLRSVSTDVSTRGQEQSEPNNMPQTKRIAFPGRARAGNITLEVHSITYHFRVSAAVSFDQTFNEGDLSPLSVNTSLFVPQPGLPTPTNAHVTESTNASITLMWNYPPPPSEAIEKFLVTYSGDIEWRSPGGVLVQFEDSGEINATINSIKISALVPGTTYTFKVSAITQSGRGAEVMFSGKTKNENVELAYFQLRMGPVRSCFDFMDFTESNIDDLVEVRNGLAQELSHLCPTCGVTHANIKDDEFSCRDGPTTQLVYRARIVGTDVYSATGLVSLMQSWVGSGRASVMVQSTRLHIDPTCGTNLDSLYDVDCANKPPTASPSTGGHGFNVGEIGGIAVGAVIAILLIALIVVIILKKWRPKVIRRYGRRTQHTVNDHMCDDVPFVDDGGHEDNSPKLNFDIDNKDDQILQ